MDKWTSNEDLEQTSNDCVEPEMAAMGQADIVWEEMEWKKMEAVEACVSAEGGPRSGPS